MTVAVTSTQYRKKLHRKAVKAAKRNRAALTHPKRHNTQKYQNSVHKRRKWVYAVVAVILATLLCAGLYFYSNIFKDEKSCTSGKFADGISIESVDISGLTMAEVESLFKNRVQDMLENTLINFEFEGTTYKKSAAEFGIITDLDDLLENAMGLNKTDSCLNNLKTTFALKQAGKDYTIGLKVDTDATAQAITEISKDFYSKPIEPEMVFDENADSGEYIYWKQGLNGVALDEEDLLNQIIEKVPMGLFDMGAVDTIVTSPQNTAAALSENVVKIAEYTTSFYGVTLSEEKRVANIEKMAALINGSVIEPGAEWSFNDCSGERNAQNGWQLANTLYGGVLVEEMGGGVCQVSSTVYNAFLLAELGIVERHAHSRPSAYVPTGLDATVDYGVKDLRVVNTLEDTIYLVVKVNKEKKTITAMIYGPKPSHDYQVIVRALIWQSNIEPDEPAEIIVAADGYAPDGTYVAPGKTYAYPKTTYGSRYKIYRYYYPLDYDDDNDSPYSWVGYVKGDNASGEKQAVQFYSDDASGKDIVTYYPPLAGTYYINPEDSE